MEQLIAHLVGDYLLQSDWMAQHKRRSTIACLLHALLYALPFLLLCWHPDMFHGYRVIRSARNGQLIDCWEYSWSIASRFHFGALAWIAGSHFVIDRFGVARYLVWAKNHLAPREIVVEGLEERGEYRYYPWEFCDKIGYYSLDEIDLNISTPNEIARNATQSTLYLILYIVADNTLHLICNYLALGYL